MLASAVSWQLNRLARPKRLKYVLGQNTEESVRQAAYALAMVLPLKSLEVQVEVDFNPLRVAPGTDLCDERWVDAIRHRERWRLPDIAGRLVEEAGEPRFRWYRSVTGKKWSGRLDGLEICCLPESGAALEFNVGRSDGEKDSKLRACFRRILDGESRRCVETDTGRAASILQRLARDLEMQSLLAGTEHRLEARVLRGDVEEVVAGGRKLRLVDTSLPFQFPARWWPEGKARFVDVMMRDGRIPWVVELKVGGGRGDYYRDGIVQAALYREYVKRSPRLAPWFMEHGLDRELCGALLVVEESKAERRPADNYREVASEFGVEYLELAQEVVRGPIGASAHGRLTRPSPRPHSRSHSLR
jgi:hypothetical protein